MPHVLYFVADWMKKHVKGLGAHFQFSAIVTKYCPFTAEKWLKRFR